MKKIVKFLLITLLLLPILGGQANAEQFKPATLINFKTGYRVAVYSDSQAQRYFSLGYELDKGLLGFSVVTNYSTTLSSSITATQTTIPVGTTKDKKGEQLATSTLGMKIYLNIEPGGNKEELVVCTGISGDSWTGCTRGLAFSGTDESAVSSYQYAHSAGSRVVMSNIHYVYQNFVDVDSNQTIGGNKTYTGTATFQGGVSNFSSIPTTATTTPTLDEQLATKKYVDSSVIAGGVVGTEITPGIWEGATQEEMASGVATSTYSGTDYSLLLQSRYASSTSSATTTIPITNTSGKIDPTFLNGTENYEWNGENTFNATTTLATTTINNDLLANNICFSNVCINNWGDDNILFSLFPISTSTNIVTNDSITESGIVTATYEKIKEIQYNDAPGDIHIEFTMARNSSDSKSRLYKNGIAVGTEVLTDSTYSQDLSVETGDLIQVYGLSTISSDPDISNFKLMYSKTIYKTNTIN